MLLGMIASLAVYLIYNVKWILFGVPAFLAGALLSGSRGGLVALGVFILALVPIVRRLRWAGTLRVVAALLVSGAVAVVLTPPYIRQLLYERFFVLSLEQRYDSGRSIYYSAAVDLFRQRPIQGWVWAVIRNAQVCSMRTISSWASLRRVGSCGFSFCSYP